ncbi:MAG: beta-ketoacyl-ACP synthase II [Clostridia bacterium]
MNRRVVVTGLGVVSPLGLDTPTFWQNLLEGRSGVGAITKFDPSDLAVKIAAEVRGFDPTDYIDRKEARRMDPCNHYAVAASAEALASSGLDLESTPNERIGVTLGTGQGGVTSLVEQLDVYREKGPSRVSPFCIPMMISNMAAGHVGMQIGARGPNLTVTTACAASAHAIGEAFRYVQRGDADVMITGGTEAGVLPLCVAGFGAMKALSTQNEQPETASRPFDRDRDGFVIGEGAAILVLETLDNARARGATILGEILGYGMSSDAHHITAPAPDGSGGARSMETALADAGLNAADVHYINAHGTGTPVGDVAEARAIHAVFGDAAKDVAVSATKSSTGHLLGAAGALESAVCLLGMRDGALPPTLNLDNPDPECDLNHIVGSPRQMQADVALTNSFGFGGQNATLIWGRGE